MQSLIRSRRVCLLAAVGTFLVFRYAYYRMGVRFDAGTLPFYWQIIDPALLRDALWQSLFYARTQPPGFNFYIGAILHLFPAHSIAAFRATSLGLGLILTVCLFSLLDRLRVNRLLAVLITVVCVVSPVTVLYENWLFYEYPIAIFFCVSALFLHRYASSGRRMDGLVLFSSLALLGLLRVLYNVVWFWMIAAVVAYALPQWRRRTVLCAAGPGAILVMTCLKSLILFGLWLPGSDVQGALNLAATATLRLPRSVVVGMASTGAISPIMVHTLDRLADPDLVDIVPMPPKTGIPILDERLKSNGNINEDSLWMAAAAIKIRQDGVVILRAHPEAALSNIAWNVRRYFLPADAGWPFDGRQQPNRRLLSRMLDIFDLVLAGKRPGHNDAWISYFTIPLLLWFGFRQSAPWLKRMIRRPNRNARNLTLGFAFGNIVYLTGVVILLSCADQNRYAFEVFPLYAILLGSLTAFVARRVPVLPSPRSHLFGSSKTLTDCVPSDGLRRLDH